MPISWPSFLLDEEGEEEEEEEAVLPDLSRRRTVGPAIITGFGREG